MTSVVAGPRFHHAHLFAADLDATLDFWRRWFDAAILYDGAAAGARNVFVDVGGGRLHFYDQPPRDHGRNAVHHLGIRVESLKALVERMREGDVAFRSSIREHATFRYVMREAPDGVLLEPFEPVVEATEDPAPTRYFLG